MYKRQVRYVAFAEDLLYGVRHGQHLKNLIRAGKPVAALDAFPGLSEALDDVKSLLAAEEQGSSKTGANLEDCTPARPEMGVAVLRIVPAESSDQKDRKEPRAAEIKFTDLDEAQQAEWLRFPRVSYTTTQQLCPPGRARRGRRSDQGARGHTGGQVRRWLQK